MPPLGNPHGVVSQAFASIKLRAYVACEIVILQTKLRLGYYTVHAR